MDKWIYQVWIARLYQFMGAAGFFVERYRFVPIASTSGSDRLEASIICNVHSVKPEERLRALLEPSLDTNEKLTVLLNKDFSLQVGVMLEETLE